MKHAILSALVLAVASTAFPLAASPASDARARAAMALAEALRQHEESAKQPSSPGTVPGCPCGHEGSKACACKQCVKRDGFACACKGCPCEAKKKPNAKPKKKLGPVAKACASAADGQFVVIFVGQPSKAVKGCVVATVKRHVGVASPGILVAQKIDGALKSVAMIRGQLQTTQKIRREIRRASPPRRAMAPMQMRSSSGGC